MALPPASFLSPAERIRLRFGYKTRVLVRCITVVALVAARALPEISAANLPHSVFDVTTYGSYVAKGDGQVNHDAATLKSILDQFHTLHTDHIQPVQRGHDLAVPFKLFVVAVEKRLWLDE